jgi:hypothetical protein
MSDDLGPRVAALEDEVKRLREIVESLSFGDIGGSLVLQLSGSSNTTVSMGVVGNNVSVVNSGEMSDLSISSGHIGNNIEVICEGDAEEVSISTGDVGQSIIAPARSS